MLLYELDIPEPLLVKLVAVSGQLKSEIDQGKQKQDWTVGELLSYYKANGLIIDRSDLFDLIKNPPLDKLISNIKGNLVIFKGQRDNETMPQDDSQKVVKQMAKDAMK